MGFIQCSACGTKISDKAVKCPYCGFQSKDATKPICNQDKYEIVPVFQYSVEGCKTNQKNSEIISYEDNSNIVQFFGDWKTIRTKFPALADVIKAMAKKDHIMAAKMDGYTKELIDKGIYHFVYDKKGEILPAIRDAKGFVKQVRIEDIKLSPNLNNSLNNLAIQIVMSQILDEIEYVGNSIQQIHIELQNDRLALADSAFDKLLQASKIQDTRKREYALLNTINSATDAKRILMRNFSQNLVFVEQKSKSLGISALLKPSSQKDVNKFTIDAFQDLLRITDLVKIECNGYAALGEYDASKKCLSQFKDFIIQNKLNERDTLLLLNENASKKQIEIVNDFSEIALRISKFDESKDITHDLDRLLVEKGSENDDENK